MMNSEKYLQKICKESLRTGSGAYYFQVIDGFAWGSDGHRAIKTPQGRIAGDGYYVWLSDLAVKIEAPEKPFNFQRVFEIPERKNVLEGVKIPQIKSKEKQPLSLPSMKLGFVAGEISVNGNDLIGMDELGAVISFDTPSMPLLFEFGDTAIMVMAMTT